MQRYVWSEEGGSAVLQIGVIRWIVTKATVACDQVMDLYRSLQLKL